MSCLRIIDRPTESMFPLETRPHIFGVQAPSSSSAHPRPPPFLFFLPPWFWFQPGRLSAKIATAELLSILGSTASGVLKRDLLTTRGLYSHLRPPSNVKLLGWSRAPTKSANTTSSERPSPTTTRVFGRRKTASDRFRLECSGRSPSILAAVGMSRRLSPRETPAAPGPCACAPFCPAEPFWRCCITWGGTYAPPAAPAGSGGGGPSGSGGWACPRGSGGSGGRSGGNSTSASLMFLLICEGAVPSALPRTSDKSSSDRWCGTFLSCTVRWGSSPAEAAVCATLLSLRLEDSSTPLQHSAMAVAARSASRSSVQPPSSGVSWSTPP